MLSLADELVLYVCLFLEQGHRACLGRTSKHFLRITRDRTLLPTILDTTICSAVPGYTDNFMHEPKRRLSVRKLIVSHVQTYPCSRPYTRHAEGMKFRDTGYGFSAFDPSTEKWRQRDVNIYRILRECPNLTHLYLPACQMGRFIFANLQGKKTGGTCTYPSITHLETNATHQGVLTYLLMECFLNLRSCNVPLRMDTVSLATKARLQCLTDVTLVANTDFRADYRSLSAWTACPMLRTLNIHRPVYSTTLPELSILAEVFFCEQSGTAVGVQHIRVLDVPDPERLTQDWADFMRLYPTVSVRPFEGFGLYDNSPCVFAP